MGTVHRRHLLGTRGALARNLQQRNGGEEEVVLPSGPAGATKGPSTSPNRKYRSMTLRVCRLLSKPTQILFLWSVSDRFLTDDFSSLRIRMVSFEPLKETSALFTGQTLACCHGTDMKATLSFIDYQQTFSWFCLARFDQVSGR